MSNLEDEDIPPLEDMTDYVERLKTKAETESKLSQTLSAKHGALLSDSSLLKLEENGLGVSNPELLVLNKLDIKDNTVSSHKTSDKQDSQEAPSAGFGGMKKGFLSGSKGQKKKPSKPSTDIPFLQSKQESNDSLRFKEVQEELKKTHPLLATKDWLNEDLLSKISSNPILSKAFADPKLFKVLEDFQKNPQQALMAAQHDPVVSEFLQQFCSLMGDHFNTMADLQDKKQPITEVKELSEEEKTVQDLLSNPKVKVALLDPDIIKLMELLKSNPNEAQRFLNTIQSDPAVRSKLTTLIENNLLSIQST